jgi:hypothetical protein
MKAVETLVVPVETNLIPDGDDAPEQEHDPDDAEMENHG